jgi:hypothetical protein
MTVLSMSKQEFSRLDVLLRVQSGRLRVSDACTLIGLHRRHVFRLLPPQAGWSCKPAVEAGTMALSIVRERYVDFAPSFAGGIQSFSSTTTSFRTHTIWTKLNGKWFGAKRLQSQPAACLPMALSGQDFQSVMGGARTR